MELPDIDTLDGHDFFLGFGHRRLSILDVSAAGHQPMTDCSGRYTIVYNGEIYNYREIRADLEALGHTFITSCDTEVILASFDEWGDTCVERFNGMWSFAIWDDKRKRLFCSRDRLGAKPFHYCYEDGKFLFGSELKQFIADPGISKDIDLPFLSTYMAYHITDYNERTMLKEVKALLPGHNLTVELSDDLSRIKSVETKRYWDLNCKYDYSISFDEWVERIRAEFARSVSWRLRSDVPLGALLSGGLDSSCMVAEIASRMDNPSELSTFTSSYPGYEKVEEWKFADMVNRHVCAKGCRYTPDPVKDGVIKKLEGLVWHLEMPTGLALIGVRDVIKEAHRQGFRVILNGQCGDETWLGYERYYAFYFAKLLKSGVSGAKKAFNEFRLAGKHSVLSWKSLMDYMLYFNLPIIRDTRAKKRAGSICRPEFLNAMKRDEFKHIIYPKGIDDLQYQELTGIQLTHICHFDDRCYMSESVESRIPFMDYRMVELACSVPPEHKIKNGFTKYNMRKAYEPKLPPEVIWRINKMGFGSPIEEWMKAFPRDYIRTMVKEAKTGDLFDRRSLWKMYKKNPVSEQFFAWLQVEIFYRQFCA